MATIDSPSFARCERRSGPRVAGTISCRNAFSLVLASIEPRFDEKTDKLFHLNLKRLNESEGEVLLEELSFVREGAVDLGLCRRFLNCASLGRWKRKTPSRLPKLCNSKKIPALEEVKSVTELLKKYLGVFDEFWSWWKYFAEQHGVRV